MLRFYTCHLNQRKAGGGRSRRLVRLREGAVQPTANGQKREAREAPTRMSLIAPFDLPQAALGGGDMHKSANQN